MIQTLHGIGYRSRAEPVPRPRPDEPASLPARRARARLRRAAHLLSFACSGLPDPARGRDQLGPGKSRRT